MACGICAECGIDTHIELMDGEHIPPYLHDAYICLKCEAAIYRWYYQCPHKHRARCTECESKKHAAIGGYEVRNGEATEPEFYEKPEGSQP